MIDLTDHILCRNSKIGKGFKVAKHDGKWHLFKKTPLSVRFKPIGVSFDTREEALDNIPELVYHDSELRTIRIGNHWYIQRKSWFRWKPIDNIPAIQLNEINENNLNF